MLWIFLIWLRLAHLENYWKKSPERSLTASECQHVADVCDSLEGWDGVGRRFRREGTCVHPWLTHVEIWQKPTQYNKAIQFSSVQSLSRVRLLQPHEPQYARPPCPSPTPRVYRNSCLLSGWCHPTISSSVVPFSSCLQSFPASGSFQMSQFFTSGGQSIGVSASTSVLPMNTWDWSPLVWTGWISLQPKGLSRVLSNTIVQKHKLFGTQLSLESNSHIHMTTWKTIVLTRWTFVGKVMSLLFNMLSRLIITFLPRTEHLLISWLQSPSRSDFGAPKNKVSHCFHYPLIKNNLIIKKEGGNKCIPMADSCWSMAET